jgi:hypothetical protein
MRGEGFGLCSFEQRLRLDEGLIEIVQLSPDRVLLDTLRNRLCHTALPILRTVGQGFRISSCALLAIIRPERGENSANV